jgi:hypothetical protein
MDHGCFGHKNLLAKLIVSQMRDKNKECLLNRRPLGTAGGIAPFYIVSLKPFGTRLQCPDDAAAETMRRKNLEE